MMIRRALSERQGVRYPPPSYDRRIISVLHWARGLCVASLAKVIPELGAYLGLFASAFAAATLLPAQSEAVLSALLLTRAHPAWLLITVASVGNVLGSTLNWLIGRSVERFRDRRWFPATPRALARAQAWYRRFGKWSLLASWVPIVGDPLTVVAGMLREPLPSFLLLVAIAKVGRYLFLAAVLLPWM